MLSACSVGVKFSGLTNASMLVVAGLILGQVKIFQVRIFF